MEKKGKMVWKGLPRGRVKKALAALSSLTRADVKELARQLNDPEYTPLLFRATGDIDAAVAVVISACESDLAARA